MSGCISLSTRKQISVFPRILKVTVLWIFLVLQRAISRLLCPHRQTCFCMFSEWNYSFSDLEDIFQKAGIGRDSPGLPQRVLRKEFRAATPNARTMECFDKDGNKRYSLTELRAAVGLWAHYHWRQWTVLNTQRGLGVWSSWPFSRNCCTFCELNIYHTDCGTVALAWQHNLIHKT